MEEHTTINIVGQETDGRASNVSEETCRSDSIIGRIDRSLSKELAPDPKRQVELESPRKTRKVKCRWQSKMYKSRASPAEYR
ncbi:unnamed protein product [Caenorhabditis nigoni]